jgi:hypothetical protein
MRWGLVSACAAVGAASLCSQTPPRDALAELRASFAHPPDDSRIMMRWWWFGPAVEKPEIAARVARHEGGRHRRRRDPAVYPLTVDGECRGSCPICRPQFLDDVRFANDKARELGMRVDITLGSGWPYGGPHTPVDLASREVCGWSACQYRPMRGNSVAMPQLCAKARSFVAAFLARTATPAIA